MGYLDEVYERTKKDVALDSVKDKKDVQKLLGSEKLADYVFDKKQAVQENGLKGLKDFSVKRKENVLVGKTSRRSYTLVYNSKKDSSRLVARNNKGRFVKFSISAVRKAMR